MKSLLLKGFALCFSIISVSAYAGYQCKVMNGRQILFYGYGHNKFVATNKAMMMCQKAAITMNKSTCHPVSCLPIKLGSSPTPSGVILKRPPRGTWQCWSRNRKGNQWTAMDIRLNHARNAAIRHCMASPFTNYAPNCSVKCKQW